MLDLSDAYDALAAYDAMCLQFWNLSNATSAYEAILESELNSTTELN
jgi:hypothetical protein